ncbi:hypothetical protein ADM99_04680 [Leptolinea tardivitalis]|uniref:Uncharacterized protein n=2 Tax=Leptolinea tardivitalis TaxID=229920 RepID=A0A0P6WTB8_9CHLR|nr:transporter substrate-binding domain-containing protein [Leptolinea tardivitalis]KPL73480.1 hypothetical protein ADM99_04680 [Leptolinea tardivitalis]GAP21655.1 amino acid ABC transporter substrate-binding protein, PAAT family [Leptolinea tardivitalis]
MSKFLPIILISIFLASCSGQVQPSYSSLTGSTPENSKQPEINRTIRLAIGEWPPYTGKNLSEYGCDSKIVKETFAQMGISVQYGFFPWARSLSFAQTGDWDGTMEWAKSKMAVEKFYISSLPISKQVWVFFHRVDRPFEWQTLDDIKSKTIGVTSGYVYSDIFDPISNQLKLEEASSDSANFKKILAGRVDIFPMEKNVGIYILNNEFTKEERDQITFNDRPLTEFEPYLLLTKANPSNEQLIKQFDDEFKKYQNSSRYREIVENCDQK